MYKIMNEREVFDPGNHQIITNLQRNGVMLDTEVGVDIDSSVLENACCCYLLGHIGGTIIDG